MAFAADGVVEEDLKAPILAAAAVVEHADDGDVDVGGHAAKQRGGHGLGHAPEGRAVHHHGGTLLGELDGPADG